MNVRVGWVLKLVGHEVATGTFVEHFLSGADGAGHAFRAFGQNKIGTERADDLAAFQTHRLRHRQVDLVTTRGTDES